MVACVIGMASCKEPDEPPIPPTTHPYTLKVPAHFPAMEVPDDNPMTIEGVQLGRRLYYDDILSGNGRSCSTCHHQDRAFSTPDPGPGGFGIMAHVNLGWSSSYGWSGGEAVLDHVALADLAEGNAFLAAINDSIQGRLARNPDYISRFRLVYGIEIHQLNHALRQFYIAKALGQFMRTQISGNSAYDRFENGQPGSDFSPAAWRGMQLFFTERGDCFHCHPSPLFTDGTFHNNGLDSILDGMNIGRESVTGRSSDRGKFKSPTLRNIALTAPYMHDGRFWTLTEVVEHYNSGVQHSPTLDPLMTKYTGSTRLDLSPQEVADLVAFLESLTDTSFVADTALASPW